MASTWRTANSAVLSLFILGLAACTDGASPAPIPVEQLPNPDFAQKPQIFFIIDETERYWNPPHPGELDLKHRVRLTLASSSDLTQLEASLRDLNSRDGDLLLFSGARLMPTAKSLALYSPPSGRKTFHFNASRTSDSSAPQIQIDLAPTLELINAVCVRWSKELKHECVWDSAIPGATKREGGSAASTSILVSFKDVNGNGLQLSLKLDWIQWMEQFLRSLAKIENSGAPWQKMSLASGTLLLDLKGQSPKTESLKKILQDERMKRL